MSIWSISTPGRRRGSIATSVRIAFAVAAFCAGKRVLDLFCYTGGFSLNALEHGRAVSTLGIDSSAPALALAQRNADGNGLKRGKV